ncbi:MAG: glycosyltransferase family 2 protein [Kaiparowitsia implicata GSE-PSE-MK54-09C]|nr:glycosyltransferase family 2 protein [Kaiparowitsia implicata GSE-PSE-MK54-09C]
MAEQPRISVIIPHLNEPDDLRKCLAALGSQASDKAVEIIVVDNGSKQMPEFATALVPGLTLLRELSPGPGPARNKGAAAAKAPLLAFIDADCVAAPGWLAAIERCFDERRDIDFAGGDIRILPANPERLTAVEAYESVYSYRTQDYAERLGFAATGNMAVRAATFRAVGPFGGIKMMEDTEWGQRASALGHKIAYIPEARVLTPSCRSFAELARRWDRHVAHEFVEQKGRPLWLMRWLAKSVIIAASPAGELMRILGSDRVVSWGERWLALITVTRVRIYRSRLMVSLAWRDNAEKMVDMWNRGNR